MVLLGAIQNYLRVEKNSKFQAILVQKSTSAKSKILKKYKLQKIFFILQKKWSQKPFWARRTMRSNTATRITSSDSRKSESPLLSRHTSLHQKSGRIREISNRCISSSRTSWELILKYVGSVLILSNSSKSGLHRTSLKKPVDNPKQSRRVCTTGNRPWRNAVLFLIYNLYRNRIYVTLKNGEKEAKTR